MSEEIIEEITEERYESTVDLDILITKFTEEADRIYYTASFASREMIIDGHGDTEKEAIEDLRHEIYRHL